MTKTGSLFYLHVFKDVGAQDVYLNDQTCFQALFRRIARREATLPTSSTPRQRSTPQCLHLCAMGGVADKKEEREGPVRNPKKARDAPKEAAQRGCFRKVVPLSAAEPTLL